MKIQEIWDREANDGKGDYIRRKAIDAREILAGDKEGKRYLKEAPKSGGEAEAKPKAAKADK